MNNRLIFKLFFIFLFLCQGCGYTPRAYFLPPHIKHLYIDTFENKTDQPNVELDLRKELVSTFQNDGNLDITSSEQADAVLDGAIVDYSRQALRYKDDEAVWEYRLKITVNFEFADLTKNNIIVKENDFAGETTFYLSGSMAKTENVARKEAITDLCRRILNKVITLW